MLQFWINFQMAIAPLYREEPVYPTRYHQTFLTHERPVLCPRPAQNSKRFNKPPKHRYCICSYACLMAYNNIIVIIIMTHYNIFTRLSWIFFKQPLFFLLFLLFLFYYFWLSSLLFPFSSSSFSFAPLFYFLLLKVNPQFIYFKSFLTVNKCI